LRQVNRHIQTLQKLKQNLLQQDEEKSRHHAYKERKKALGPRPTKLEDFLQSSDGGGGSGSAGGGTMRSWSSRGSTPASRGDDLGSSHGTGAGPRAAGGGGGGAGGGGGTGGASTTLMSLNKLVELEKRIAKLESSDAYEATETPRSRVSSAAGGRPAFRNKAVVFTKMVTPSRLDAPTKTVFGVKLVDKAAASKGNTRSASRSNAVAGKWLAERKQVAAARRSRVATDSNARGAGASSWVRDRAGECGAVRE
jgi:hypothetical protein